jgi:hypothetical protein
MGRVAGCGAAAGVDGKGGWKGCANTPLQLDVMNKPAGIMRHERGMKGGGRARCTRHVACITRSSYASRVDVISFSAGCPWSREPNAPQDDGDGDGEGVGVGGATTTKTQRRGEGGGGGGGGVTMTMQMRLGAGGAGATAAQSALGTDSAVAGGRAKIAKMIKKKLNKNENRKMVNGNSTCRQPGWLLT